MLNRQADAESIRARQRFEWTVAASGWHHHREAISGPTRLITEILIKMARISEGQRVLDLACGTGDPAFALAERVGSAGYVLGLDITEAMLESSRAWAREHSIQNVEFRQIASELKLSVPQNSFDAATCRHGLMYMPDPVAALQAIQESLKPGGRIAISTWGPLEHCPFATVLMQTITHHISQSLLNPRVPNPFALSTRGTLKRILGDAGFTNAQVEILDVTVIKAESPEVPWDLISEVAGPLSTILDTIPEQTRQLIREDSIQTFETMFGGGPITLNGEALVAVGTKPQ